MSLFFLNLDKEVEERFDLSRFFRFTDNFDVLTSAFLQQLKGLPVRGQFTVQTEENRPDLVSFGVYGTTQHWAIILFFNDIFEIEELKTGKVLNIPALDEIEDLLFTLKSKETALVS